MQMYVCTGEPETRESQAQGQHGLHKESEFRLKLQNEILSQQCPQISSVQPLCKVI